ncbi:MAG: DUF1704 domain-containing protein [Pseudomonadales bacterium]|nr:DUF1704 domain-containing protein [Pseudomonadales bacterium]
MSLITDLIPINLNEEKEKFFIDNSYNPQFVYENETSDEKIYNHGKPSLQHIQLANQILEKTFLGRNEQDLIMMEGPLITQSYTEKTIKTFLNMHQLHKKYNIIWSSSFVSRTSIYADTIKLKLPVTFRKEGLLGMVYHEIGTHAIRQINYEKQPWYRRKKQFGFSNYLKTEEGLATLHAIIPHSHKSAYVSAIRYLAVTYAQSNSFAETFKKISKYINDPNRCWTVTFRQKRGLRDTSKPGGFSKDLVYFEGMVDVWLWLRANNYDLTKLYFGKLAKEDADLAYSLNPDFVPKLPSFFTLNRQSYAEEINKIGIFNNFDQLS